MPDVRRKGEVPCDGGRGRAGPAAAPGGGVQGARGLLKGSLAHGSDGTNPPRTLRWE